MTTENEAEKLYNTLVSLVVSFFPIIVVIILVALGTITIMSGIMIITIVILALYIFNLSFNLSLSTNLGSQDNSDCSVCGTSKCEKHAELHRLHTHLHSGNGYGSGYRQGLGNTSTCPNGLPIWEHYLRKYGLLYDDLGTEQRIPDDGIKYVVVEYNTPTSDSGISLSEVQIWESTGTTSTDDTTTNEYVVSGLTNIAPQASIDITTGHITSNDPNTDLSGNRPDTCADLNMSLNTGSSVYYHQHGSSGTQNSNHVNNHYGPNGHHHPSTHSYNNPNGNHDPSTHSHNNNTGYMREPIDGNHYNENHDPSTHSHNNPNARPIYQYHNDDHGIHNNVTHSREHRSLYDQHIEDHYIEGMTTDLKSTLTNNNFADQYLNIVTDASSNTVVQQETMKVGLHTAKNHDELYVVRLITPTTLMNATVSLLNGNQQVLYSKNIKETANVYTFKLGATGNESNINTALDNYDSSYTQKLYDVCPIPQNRKQYAIQHRANNPNNNMNCTTETFVSTINLKPLSIKANPITRDLI